MADPTNEPGEIQLIWDDGDAVGEEVQVFGDFAFLSAFPSDIFTVGTRGLVTALQEGV